jgi:hypothetical protein
VVDGDSTSLKDSINMSERTMDDNVGKAADQVLKQNIVYIEGEVLQKVNATQVSPRNLNKEYQSFKSMSKCSSSIKNFITNSLTEI